MWPRYGILLEVADGNWVPCGPKQNHRVLEETRPLNARHAWPTGEWIRPGVCNPGPQQWANCTPHGYWMVPPLHHWTDELHKTANGHGGVSPLVTKRPSGKGENLKSGVGTRRRSSATRNTVPASPAAKLAPNVMLCIPLDPVSKAERGDPDDWAT